MMDDEYLDLDTKNGEYSDYQDIPWSHDDPYYFSRGDKICLTVFLLITTGLVVLAVVWL